MIIQKEYKFYAAHRNEQLEDKCHNLHGHRYGITCHFEVERTGELTTLFDDFDREIEPFLKKEYDHSMMINVNDPLYEALRSYTLRTGDAMKFTRFDRPTTVENLAHKLFTELIEMGYPLVRLDVRETDTSVVCYTSDDWIRDREYFAAQDRSGIPLAS